VRAENEAVELLASIYQAGNAQCGLMLSSPNFETKRPTRRSTVSCRARRHFMSSGLNPERLGQKYSGRSLVSGVSLSAS
jgi:hypothetical protein